MKRNNLKAFTVLEVLINILITSIIVGMVYYTYSSYTKQVSYYKEDVEEQHQLNRFLLQLKTDFYEAEKVLRRSEGFQIVFYNTRTINYEINGPVLIRNQNGTLDSLFISSIDFDTKIDPESDEEFIGKVALGTSLFEQPLEFVLTKEYPFLFDYELAYGN